MSKAAPRPAELARLRSAVLCEQFRNEDNGKRLLVGVYDFGVIVGFVPQVFAACVYGTFELLGRGITSLDLRLTAPGFEREAAVSLSEDPISGRFAVFSLPFGCLIETESQIRLSWKVNKGEWVEGISWGLQLTEHTQTLDDKEATKAKAIFAATAGTLQGAQ
jgi:hypothetical protein